MRVAFLFLTIGGLSREDIWKRFFEGVDPQLYVIFCHPKYADRIGKGSILVDHVLEERVETHWASVSLVRATILLLAAAVRDARTTRFVLVSDSCIPILPFAPFYRQIMEQPCSSFAYNPDYRRTDDIHGRYRRFGNKNMIPMDRFMKAHQWFVLDRQAAVLCAEGRHIKDFEKVFASDEHYFINICNHYRIPFMNQRRTFVEFEYEKSHPRVFHEISLAFLRHLRSQGYFFLRKIKNPLLFLP